MPFLAGIGESLQLKVKLYLNKEVGLPPPVFFALLIYGYLLGLEIVESPFYLFALVLVAVFQLNMLWALPSYIFATNPVVSGLMFLASVLSCTDKGKALIFLFCSLNSFSGGPNTYSQVMTVSCLFMCLIIYKNLTFDSIKENKQFFMGFFILMVVHGFINISYFFSIELSLVSLASLGLASGSLGYSIILYRFSSLRSKDIDHIKSSREIAHYIALLKEDLQN